MAALRSLIGPLQLKCVNFGVDTLLVNFKLSDDDVLPNGAPLPEPVCFQLDEWQAVARKEHEPVATSWVFHGKTLHMQPHGDGVFPWMLFTEDVKLYFSYGTMNGAICCQARFASHYLWSVEPVQAVVDLQAFLYEQLGTMTHAQASEIHVCADLQGWYDGPSDWQEGFVSRVVSMRARPEQLPTEREQEGGLTPKERRDLEAVYEVTPTVRTTYRRLSTLDFGSHGSEIMGQIYNKSLEIQKSKKTFFEDIWRSNGWDGVSTVWRIEFRFRRKALSSFDLNDVFLVLSSLPALWDYATCQWLRYVEMETGAVDTNKSRWPVHPVWLVVQAAYLGAEQAASEQGQAERAALVKRARRMASKKMCVSAIAGYLTSLMALSVEEVAQQPDLVASLVVALEAVRQYNEKRHRSHLEEVWKKRLRYGFVTAQELDEQRRLHGIDLMDVDRKAWQAAIEQVMQRPADIYLNPFGDEHTA